MHKVHKQEPPFCIQIELVEGCNLRCGFCGLNGIRGKDNDYKFMPDLLAARIINQIKNSGWNPRIEFAMHGEPSVHPNLLEIISKFRHRLGPKYHLMMTSNGVGLLKDPTNLIDGLLENLNVLALDVYEGISIVQKIFRLYKGVHRPILYPENPKGNPHRRRSPKEHDLIVVADIAEATKGTHADLNTHCGGGMQPGKVNPLLNERCAKLFRELSIRWDGNVALCCNDFRGIYKIGNVRDFNSLDDLWNSPKFTAARRMLYHEDRDFVPCLWCNAKSYRTGLLPDKYGKETLPKPTQRDHMVLLESVGGESYTLPVLRSWEVPGSVCLPETKENSPTQKS